MCLHEARAEYLVVGHSEPARSAFSVQRVDWRQTYMNGAVPPEYRSFYSSRGVIQVKEVLDLNGQPKTLVNEDLKYLMPSVEPEQPRPQDRAHSLALSLCDEATRS